MYQTTVSACKELSSLSAEATGVTYQMDILFQASILEEAKKDPDLNGLNLSILRPSDLLVAHVNGNLEVGGVRRFAGFKNVRNTCFINASLQAFLNVDSLRSQINNPLSPIVVTSSQIDEKLLTRLQQALKEVELWHASNKWSLIVPIRVLQSVFSIGTQRHGMIAGEQGDAVECFKMFCNSVGLSEGPQCLFMDALQYPQGIDEEVQMSIAQLVELLHANERITVPVPPKTFVLGLVPFQDDNRD